MLNLRVGRLMLPFLATIGATPVEVVLARFDEPVDWADAHHEQAKITVYDKSASPVQGSIHLPNVGRESHSYLHHIVSRYDSLADWTVFSQAGRPSFGYVGHRSGGGHLNQGVAFADYLQPRKHSFFVDTAAFDSASFASSLRLSYAIDDVALASKDMCAKDGEWSDWWSMGWFEDYVRAKVQSQNGTDVTTFYNKYVRPESAPVEAVQLSFPQGARFAVSADAIRARPKAYYETLLQTVSRDVDPWAGYYMEWMWPTVFGRDPRACPLPAHTASPIAHGAAMAKLENTFAAHAPAAASARRQLSASPNPSPSPDATVCAYGCVEQFHANGGCEVWHNGQDPTHSIPPGCDSGCEEPAREYCTEMGLPPTDPIDPSPSPSPVTDGGEYCWTAVFLSHMTPMQMQMMGNPTAGSKVSAAMKAILEQDEESWSYMQAMLTCPSPSPSPSPHATTTPSPSATPAIDILTPTPTPQPPVVLRLVAKGSVSDYEEPTKRNQIKAKVAELAGVDPMFVSITITAASVLITATIQVPPETTVAAVQSSLTTSLSANKAVQAFEGVLEVEEVRSIAVAAPPPSPLSPPPPSPLSPPPRSPSSPPSPSSNTTAETSGDAVSDDDSGSGALVPIIVTLAVLVLLVGGGFALYYLRKNQQKNQKNTRVNMDEPVLTPTAEKAAEFPTLMADDKI